MDMTLRPPPPHLAGSAIALWELRGVPVGRYAGLPKPYAELIVSLSGAHRWYAADHAPALPYDHGWVTPVQALPRWAQTTGPLHLVGARLSPLAAARLFGPGLSRQPAHPVPLDALLGRGAALLRERLLEAATTDARLAILSDWLSHRLAAANSAQWLPEPALLARSGWRVDGLADILGLSPRGLHKRFASEIGIGPKLWLQLHRFDAVLRAAPHSASLAGLAAAFGYADQAHLTAEFTRFAGQAPGGYRNGRRLGSAVAEAPHFVPAAG